ncbi:ribonucleases P/MRP protein subunit POP1 [Cloeon dipterum]|uniref:ribonucleases P/MRP protein subunit POP1 n=1 Tax=Cloeon dipterum TaxID=197152 RepID=UPI00321F80E3
MDVGVARFLESRIEEIRALSQRINTGRPMLAFQRLPRHMKRRVMGHSSKRIPRSILDLHLKQQAKSGAPKKMKMPSRKHRRRPKNARTEFERRQEGVNRWLETHLWHAKRFRMVTRWGFKLAETPCDKGWRACWRASISHCLMFDLSYTLCVELSGRESDLFSTLEKLTSEDCRANNLNPEVAAGSKEGQIVLYTPGEYPKGCIGPAKLMWRPQGAEETRQLWLWCHPGLRNEVLENMSKVIGDKQVTVTALDEEFNRYRLVGPLTMPVLRDAIVSFDGTNPPDWLDKTLFQNQTEVWTQLRNTGQAVQNAIVGLTVKSVSRNAIPKRKKSLKSEEHVMETDQICQSTDSQLWSKEVRSQVVTSLESPAPVMLVHQPAPNGKHGEGWDLITPRKHGLQLWLRMIMCGARVGALKQYLELNWNNLNAEDLCLYPDSLMGNSEEKDLSQREKDRFDSLPPNKRLGVPWFTLPWQQLINEWSMTGAGSFFVIRDKTQLQMADQFMEKREECKFGAEEGLVAILVCLENGGNLERGSAVCLPAGPDDLSNPRKEDASLRALQRRLQPEDGLKVSDIFSRRVAGFVLEGGYSFHRGCSAGVAFVTAAAVKQLFSTSVWNECLQVLIINKRCPLYRNASVKIV